MHQGLRKKSTAQQVSPRSVIFLLQLFDWLLIQMPNLLQSIQKMPQMADAGKSRERMLRFWQQIGKRTNENEESEENYLITIWMIQG
jgi:hypothetical protein